MLDVTLEDIRARCDDVAGCWMWRGPFDGHGSPKIYRSDGFTPMVRRIVLGLVGRAPSAGIPVVAACGHKRCVNPAHLRTTTYKDLLAATLRSSSAYQSPLRIARIARSHRQAPGVKLDVSKARDIRASTGPAREQASRYGISESLVYAIRCGDRWKDFSNPWLGLMP